MLSSVFRILVKKFFLFNFLISVQRTLISKTLLINLFRPSIVSEITGNFEGYAGVPMSWASSELCWTKLTGHKLQQMTN